MLVTRIQHKRNASNAPVLCMHPAEGLGIEVALDKDVLHSLSALLRDAVARAEWDLTLQPTADIVVREAPATLN